MGLAETYRDLMNGIVAFVPRHVPGFDWNDFSSLKAIPPILGTGFVVSTDGYVVTCKHVVDAFGPGRQSTERVGAEYDFLAMLFYCYGPNTPGFRADASGVIVLLFEPQGVSVPRVSGLPMAPEIPDMAIVRLRVSEMPVALRFSERPPPIIAAGLRVATAGWPMGTEPLMSPGYVHQCTPMLQDGIIRAVLPYPYCPTPHTLIVDVVAAGGQSGSPVFLPDDGRVIGILYAVQPEVYGNERARYHVPSAVTYVVPSYFAKLTLDLCKDFLSYKPAPGTPRFSELVARARPLDSLGPSSDAGLPQEN